MRSGEFDEYLRVLATLLRTSRSRREDILRELREHFEERLEDLERQGIGHREAISLILGEFGDAAVLATQFLHVIQQRKRRWVMRGTISAIGVAMVTTVLTLAYWPSPHGMMRNLATAGNEAAVEATLLPAQETAQDALTQRKLAQSISVEYADKALSDCLADLTDKLGFQCYIDPKIADAGIEPDTLVSLKLKDVPADMVLELMLRPYDLSYMVRNGVVIVSTPEEFETPQFLVLRIYDPAAYGIDGGTTDELIELITCMACPTSWSSAGGSAEIAPFGKLCVVRQTASILRQIDELFVKLGEANKKGDGGK
jgi:hypothetical protein